MKKAVRIADLMSPAPAAEPMPVAARAESAPARRQGRSHTTLYLDRRVLREIRGIALQFDRKPHDLLIEGINLMLAHYGRASVETLSKE